MTEGYLIFFFLWTLKHFSVCWRVVGFSQCFYRCSIILRCIILKVSNEANVLIFVDNGYVVVSFATSCLFSQDFSQSQHVRGDPLDYYQYRISIFVRFGQALFQNVDLRSTREGTKWVADNNNVAVFQVWIWDHDFCAPPVWRFRSENGIDLSVMFSIHIVLQYNIMHCRSVLAVQ